MQAARHRKQVGIVARPIWILAAAILLVIPVACNGSMDRGVADRAAPTLQETAGEGSEHGVETLPEISPVALAEDEELRVVATTSIVADVVAQVGGDHIDLTALMPPGTDPHGYTATPQDLRALSDAHVIFLNGLGLEEALLPILENRSGEGVVVSVSAGIAPIVHDEESPETSHEGADPHTWFSVRNVQTWTTNIAQTLDALDPAHAADYQANAAAYHKTLDALDAEIRAAVEMLPAEARKIVTDHDEFAYFAADYGFTIVGTVIPSLSTQASPSAQELAQLHEQIRQEGVKAIFTGNAINPRLEEQLAADTGIQVVRLYTASLSDARGPASSYVELMRYNVSAMVEALR